MLKREEILPCLEAVLEPLDYVNAMWQCGSAAFNRIDEWSDVDVVIDVKDDKVKDVFVEIEKALEALSPFEDKTGGPTPLSPGAFQMVYKLKDTSRFMIIEVCAVPESGSQKFLEREIHGNIIVNFDKKNVTTVAPINREDFASKLTKRLNQIKKFFDMYQILVEKELNRNNHIEAIAFYQSFIVYPLIELIRIRHNPYRYNFRTRYVYYDLPEEIVKKLHQQMFIANSDELKNKFNEAIKWFNDIHTELTNMDIMDLL